MLRRPNAIRFNVAGIRVCPLTTGVGVVQITTSLAATVECSILPRNQEIGTSNVQEGNSHVAALFDLEGTGSVEADICWLTSLLRGDDQALEVGDVGKPLLVEVFNLRPVVSAAELIITIDSSLQLDESVV
jgi:hypothetical protein